MSERYNHGPVQRVIGGVLIPEVREHQTTLAATEDTLPIALELVYTALGMKPAYHHPALFIARRYAARMGLDPDQVEAFARHRIAEELEAQ